MSTDQTFITNENGQSLCDRFGDLLRKDTRFFDCLVGYFFINGFHNLYPHLAGVEKIRILVGIKTDKQTVNLIQAAESHATAKKLYCEAVLDEFENSTDDSAKTEDGVRKFVEWIKCGKLEVRAYPSAQLHAKLYIMTFPEGDRDAGRVITGSSNFTKAGLSENLEFNVELKDRSDYDFAIKKFNELWAQSVDVTMDCATTIERKSPYAEFTPYELYLKFLYEYFRGELNRPETIEDTEDVDIASGFKKLRYQEEAVLSAKRILDEYGGVFLADVVGLGKTYMSALLAREIHEPCIVIAPPHLLDEDNPGSWPCVFQRFGVRSPLCRSLGKLDAILQRNDLQKYTTVFIDESHRFRTEDTPTYEKLAQICRGKRVVLVSATPLNNSPQDILSQIKLFQPGKNSTIPNVKNLEQFFATLRRRFDGLDRQRDRDNYFKTVKENAKETREKVLKFLMIRRTRSEIEKYYGADLKKQGLKFPEVVSPEPLFYKLNKTEAEVFDATIRAFTHDCKYVRYTPFVYYTGEHATQEIQSQRNLAKFMKILAVKRLESSFAAFRSTLDRFIKTYQRVIAEFHKGNVFISKKHIGKVFELLESGDHERIEQLLADDKAERLSAEDFEPEFIADLESDLNVLQNVRDDWQRVTRDPKWESFRDILQTKLNAGKLIIFTESKETAEYLAAKIRDEVEPKTLLFTGASSSSVREDVTANFDANAHKPQDDYRILVATEVLAEGVNLHRANVVINYDIPWNPTRLIQRVGRVNRVDTKFDTIHTYNFFPTDDGNDVIKLREAAEAKIHAFIQMLGADARLLTDSEEIVSHDLFAKLNSKKTITGEDENEETELKYLTEIRRIRDENPALFDRIKRLPKKARSTRTVPKDSVPTPALLTYVRKEKLDKFFISDTQSRDATELDFTSAAATLKPADQKELRQPIPFLAFYELLVKNTEAFKTATITDADQDAVTHRGSSNDDYILKRLKANNVRRCEQFTEDDEEFVGKVVALLDDGMLPKNTAQKVAAALKQPENRDPLKVLAVLRRSIPQAFMQTSSDIHAKQTAPREVILSALLITAANVMKAGNVAGIPAE